jgi:hypothetical protein
VCCLFSLEESRLDLLIIWHQFPKRPRKEPLLQGNLLFFFLQKRWSSSHCYFEPSRSHYWIVGVAFSTQVIPNAVSSSVVSTSPQEHQPHVDPSPSSSVRYSFPSSLERSSSISSSLLSEISQASNVVNKKKKKRKNKKKKNKQGFKLSTTTKHVGKQPATVNRAWSLDDVKITQTTRKPKYPCTLCKGSHLLNYCPSLSKVIESWSTHPHQPKSSSSEQHVDDLPSTSQDTIKKKKSRAKFLCMLCKGHHLTHLFSHMDEASKL